MQAKGQRRNGGGVTLQRMQYQSGQFRLSQREDGSAVLQYLPALGRVHLSERSFDLSASAASDVAGR